MIDSKDKDELISRLDRLNDYIASKEYSDLKMDPNTPVEARRTLVALVKERGELAQALVKIFGKDISSNDAKFRDLLNTMKEVADNAEKAQKELGNMTKKIEAVTKMANFVDNALKLAAGLLK